MGRHAKREKVVLGTWSATEVDRMLAAVQNIPGPARRIAFVSRRFLSIPYREFSLIGDVRTPEILTIDLEGVDCFTYLDYVEAMRRSATYAAFKKTLRTVRYRHGNVAYTSRNHFFTDWIESNPYVEDVTAKVGREDTKTVSKRLNDRANGTAYVPGVPPRERCVVYIPGRVIDSSILARLRTGDYMGIYSRAKGLDVSHVGIVIRSRNHVLLRHASSASSKRKVVEEDLLDYLAGKAGIVVLRPRATPRPLRP